MTGQPLTKQMFAAIEEAGGEDLIFPLLAEGQTVTEIARMLNEEYTAYGLAALSRGVLSTWCNRKERKERYLEARRIGAAMFAEDSVILTDECIPEKGHVQKAKMQSDSRRWFAGKLDHDAWGQRDKTSTVLNVNHLHLEAVRSLGSASARAIESDQGVLEGEIVENSDCDDDWLE